MARANSPLILHTATNDQHEEIRHERDLQVLQETAISNHPRQLSLLSLPRCRHRITQDVAAITDLGATRHCLDLDLADDLGGRVT
jgi:hypothetical protein